MPLIYIYIYIYISRLEALLYEIKKDRKIMATITMDWMIPTENGTCWYIYISLSVILSLSVYRPVCVCVCVGVCVRAGLPVCLTVYICVPECMHICIIRAYLSLSLSLSLYVHVRMPACIYARSSIRLFVVHTP